MRGATGPGQLFMLWPTGVRVHSDSALETTSLARIVGLLLLLVKACSVTRNHCWQHENWRHLGISHRIARPPQSLDHSSEQKQKGPASSAYALVSK